MSVTTGVSILTSVTFGGGGRIIPIISSGRLRARRSPVSPAIPRRAGRRVWLLRLQQGSALGIDHLGAIIILK